jgi:hypothetical protein
MFETGSANYVIAVIDFQNVHQSLSQEPKGINYTNAEVEPALWSVARYVAPTGLLKIMK